MWLISDKSVKLGVSILGSAIVAKYAGIQGFGMINYCLSVAGIFVALSTMGSDHINVSEITKTEVSKRDNLFYSMLTVRLSWSAIITIVSASYFFFFLEEEYRLSAYLFLPQIFLTSLLLINSRLYAENRYKLVSQIGIASSLFALLIRFLFIRWEIPYVYITILYSAELAFLLYLIFTIGGNGFVNLLRHLRRTRFDYKYLKLCLPTAVSTALVTFYLRIEFFAIESIYNDKNLLGIWSVVSFFNVPWTILSASILTIFNNRLAANQQTNQASYDTAMMKLLRYMLAAAFASYLINIVSANILIVAMFGKEYRPASELVWITSLSIIPVYMGSVQELWIAHFRKTKVVLFKVLLGIPLSILSILLFTKMFGFKGVAIAMVVSYFCTAIFFNAFLAKPFFKLQLRSLFLWKT
jgi:PST family polysaccharide transporter